MKPLKTIKLNPPDSSDDSIENQPNLKIVLFYDNAELSKHEDLMIQANFCDLPAVPPEIYTYENTLKSQHKILFDN